MGSHGRRGISRLLWGSKAEEVVRECPCPVLVVKALPEVARRRSGGRGSRERLSRLIQSTQLICTGGLSHDGHQALISRIDQEIAAEVGRQKAAGPTGASNREHELRLQRYETEARHIIEPVKPRLDAFIERFKAVVKAEPDGSRTHPRREPDLRRHRGEGDLTLRGVPGPGREPAAGMHSGHHPGRGPLRQAVGHGVSLRATSGRRGRPVVRFPSSAGPRLGLPGQGQLQGRGAGQEGRRPLRDRPAHLPGGPEAGRGQPRGGGGPGQAAGRGPRAGGGGCRHAARSAGKSTTRSSATTAKRWRRKRP